MPDQIQRTTDLPVYPKSFLPIRSSTPVLSEAWPLPASAPMLLGDAPPVVAPLLCVHCDKPFRNHTWRSECIGAPETDGSDLELMGTTWSPRVRELVAPPAEAMARAHFALPVQAFDGEGRAVPFLTPSLAELMGDPEYDFLAERAADDWVRPISRLERARRAMDRDASKPLSFEAKGILCFLSVAIPVVVALLVNTVGRR